VIELRQLSRIFEVGDQKVHALRAIDLTIEPGEYVSIMGPSGSGKSTLLHLLGLLDRPTSGQYLLDGDDVGSLDETRQARIRQRRIGFVFQFFHLIPRLTAAQNVELPLVLAGLTPHERRERVGRALESFGLSDRSDHRPDQLSGGQRQRVAIARATILEPKVMLTDEPTGNLDRKTGREVVALLEKLWESGLTLLIVTHDPEVGERARRRLTLRDGRIAGDVKAEGAER
jgi:putative ABC transport system ATP-binding protein